MMGQTVLVIRVIFAFIPPWFKFRRGRRRNARLRDSYSDNVKTPAPIVNDTPNVLQNPAGFARRMALLRGQVSETAGISMDFRRAAMLREALRHAHAVGDY